MLITFAFCILLIGRNTLDQEASTWQSINSIRTFNIISSDRIDTDMDSTC